MPYEDGDLAPGDLGGGGYGAFEGDLGEKLRPLAGFGRDLTDFEDLGDEFEEFCFSFVPEGVSTQTNVSFFLRGWSTKRDLAD